MQSKLLVLVLFVVALFSGVKAESEDNSPSHEWFGGSGYGGYGGLFGGWGQNMWGRGRMSRYGGLGGYGNYGGYGSYRGYGSYGRMW